MLTHNCPVLSCRPSVGHRHSKGRNFEVIGQKDKTTMNFLLEVSPLSQKRRKVHSCFGQCGFSNAIAVHTHREIYGQTTLPREPQIVGSGVAHNCFGKVLPKSPVPLLVRIGQSRSDHRFGKAKMIKGRGLGIQTPRYISQSLPPSRLGKCHVEQLAKSKMPVMRLCVVARCPSERVSANA